MLEAHPSYAHDTLDTRTRSPTLLFTCSKPQELEADVALCTPCGRYQLRWHPCDLTPRTDEGHADQHVAALRQHPSITISISNSCIRCHQHYSIYRSS